MCNQVCKQYIQIEKTTISYGLALTWGCLWIHRHSHCHFTAKLANLLPKHLKLLQCLHGALDIRHALKCILESTEHFLSWFRGLKDTFERMTDVQSAVQALQELEMYP